MISPSEKLPLSIQPDQLLIRRMRDADVPGIMEIESVSFGSHHWSEESFINEMKNYLARYYSLVDKRDSRLIGYCGFWAVFDEAHVTTVAVRPEYRRNALGEVQLIHMMDQCMGQTIRWMTLEVRTSNYGAQNLYYKYGFSSAGTRPKYYQDNEEDALIMTTPDINSEPYRKLYRKNKEALIDRIGGFPEGMGS
ncbi:MAG: ribosomal protein S18-alanine N-acetyltransferase [Vampirovibrio sp.]|nr:ribosomal protein S18-alanine N-acetyltransferase [Vampirovibrio sp.]